MHFMLEEVVSLSLNLISASLINSFTEFIQTSSLQNFRQVQQINQKIIKPILSESQSLCYSYSKQMESLWLALKERFQFNDELINSYPSLLKIFVNLQSILNVKEQNSDLQILENQRDKSNISFSQQYQKRIIPQHVSEVDQTQDILSTDIRKANYLDNLQFFHEGVSVQVEDVSKLDVIAFSSIYQFDEQKMQILKSIGAMINSGGGTILFGCKRENLSLITYGQTIQKKQKRSIQQQLAGCLSYFYQKLSFKDNIKLQFVPMAEYQPENQFCKQAPRLFIKNKYVTALLLLPNQPEKAVFLIINNEMLFFKRKNGKTIQVRGQQISKFIKAKFYRRYLLQSEKAILTTNQRNTSISQFFASGNNDTRIQQNYNPYKPIMDSYRLEHKFDYVSAVFLHRNILSTVVNHLIQRNIRNFKFCAHTRSIIRKNKQIKIQKDPILLFHMTSPKKLKEILQSCLSINNNESVKLSNITNSLKLNRPMLKEEFDSALTFLRQKKQTEYLIYYVPIVGEAYYIQTGSKVSFFYLYGYLIQKDFKNIKFRYIENINEIKGMRKKFSSSYLQ